MSGTAQAILINEKESLQWQRAHVILSQEESYMYNALCHRLISVPELWLHVEF